MCLNMYVIIKGQKNQKSQILQALQNVELNNTSIRWNSSGCSKNLGLSEKGNRQHFSMLQEITV